MLNCLIVTGASETVPVETVVAAAPLAGPDGRAVALHAAGLLVELPLAEEPVDGDVLERRQTPPDLLADLGSLPHLTKVDTV